MIDRLKQVTPILLRTSIGININNTKQWEEMQLLGGNKRRSKTSKNTELSYANAKTSMIFKDNPATKLHFTEENERYHRSTTQY